MTDYEQNGPRAAFTRTMNKVVRRVAGLVLLSIAIGLSTCQALDGVREAGDTTTQIEAR